MATPIPENIAAFRLDEIVAATRGTVLVSGPTEFCRVVTDTRAKLDDGVFVALVGERFDAHQFLQAAIDQGARCLVVHDTPEVKALCARLSQLHPDSPVSVVVVEDTLVALADLALFHRNRFSVRVVAVVGSAGKTTTRSAISALMERICPGKVLSTRGNLNNRIGVPMTLLGLNAGHQYAVLELGTNCPGEIAELGRIVRPYVGLLTLIDLEHTEGLGDLDGVQREESALFEHLAPEGIAVGYGEDERVLRSIQRAAGTRCLSYGQMPDRDLKIVERRFTPPGNSQLILQRRDKTTLSFSTSLIGQAGALAASGAILAVEALVGRQLSSMECADALAQVGESGRHTVIQLSHGRLLVDDTYNSNPASVAICIATGQELARHTGGRLWLVLGEMRELGELSASSHQRMGELAGASGAAAVFLVAGDAQLALAPARQHIENVKFFDDAGPVAAELAPLLSPSDVVVVKASRGVRAERVVQDLARSLSGSVSPLSDRS